VPKGSVVVATASVVVVASVVAGTVVGGMASVVVAATLVSVAVVVAAAVVSGAVVRLIESSPQAASRVPIIRRTRRRFIGISHEMCDHNQWIRTTCCRVEENGPSEGTRHPPPISYAPT